MDLDTVPEDIRTCTGPGGGGSASRLERVPIFPPSQGVCLKRKRQSAVASEDDARCSSGSEYTHGEKLIESTQDAVRGQVERLRGRKRPKLSQGHSFEHTVAQDQSRVQYGDVYNITSCDSKCQGVISKLQEQFQSQEIRFAELQNQLTKLMRYVQDTVPRSITGRISVLEDAHGRTWRIDIDTISGWKEFDSLLYHKFENDRGLRRIQDSKYLLRDSDNTKQINPTRRPGFVSVFKPGQSIQMSMYFSWDEVRHHGCPKCTSEQQSLPGLETTCSTCGFTYTPGLNEMFENERPRADVRSTLEVFAPKAHISKDAQEVSSHKDVDLPEYFKRVSVGAKIPPEDDKDSSKSNSAGVSGSDSTQPISNDELIVDRYPPGYFADRHVTELSSLSELVQTYPGTFQCVLCPKRFSRASNLRAHLRIHTDTRPFICIVCGKAFTWERDHKRHEKIHNIKTNFVCKGTLQSGNQWGCGRRFARADALDTHYRSEVGRVCIKPLLDEKAAKRQKAYLEEQARQQSPAHAEDLGTYESCDQALPYPENQGERRVLTPRSPVLHRAFGGPSIPWSEDWIGTATPLQPPSAVNHNRDLPEDIRQSLNSGIGQDVYRSPFNKILDQPNDSRGRQAMMNQPTFGSETNFNHPRGRPADARASTGVYTCTYHGCTQRFDNRAALHKHRRDYHRSQQYRYSATGTDTGVMASTHSTVSPPLSAFSDPTYPGTADLGGFGHNTELEHGTFSDDQDDDD